MLPYGYKTLFYYSTLLLFYIFLPPKNCWSWLGFVHFRGLKEVPKSRLMSLSTLVKTHKMISPSAFPNGLFSLRREEPTVTHYGEQLSVCLWQPNLDITHVKYTYIVISWHALHADLVFTLCIKPGLYGSITGHIASLQ